MTAHLSSVSCWVNAVIFGTGGTMNFGLAVRKVRISASTVFNISVRRMIEIREFKINDATAATTPQNLHT